MSPLLLWSRWPQVLARLASAKRVALLLDYDGTLVPIAGHPSRATPPGAVRTLLRRLSAVPGVAVCLVSGRSLRDLRRMVDVDGLMYVGNHGLELRGPRVRYVHPRALASRGVMRELASALRTALAPVRGAWVEDKELTLSVHCRQVASAQRAAVMSAVRRAVRRAVARRLVRVTAGRRVLEIRPSVRWTKGTMAIRLIARLGGPAGGVLPVYIGDDVTDEDAFAALRGRGVTVAVAPSPPATQARYYVRGPLEVRRFLRAVLAARRTKRRTPDARA